MTEKAKLLQIRENRSTANWARVWPQACNKSVRDRTLLENAKVQIQEPWEDFTVSPSLDAS
jgi:hypothetical protein